MLDSAEFHTAIILPGAVAKGAYEAGVLYELAHANVKIDRIVATSSGALNGIVYAAGVRAGDPKGMTSRLLDSWVNEGSWRDAFRINVKDLILRRGISDQRGLRAMLESLVQPTAELKRLSTNHHRPHEVELRIIVTPLRGVKGAIGQMPATTYEKVICFSGKDFETAESLDRVFHATTAACAFPGVYAPVNIEGLGPCVDGGSVNNAPIAYGLSEGDVNRIIMPVPFPALMDTSMALEGLSLANHMIEILINERLYRDLKEAEVINGDVARLEKMVESGILSSSQAKAVRDALRIHTVQIMEIRPEVPTPGSSFSGFFSKNERLQLIEAGRRAARAAVESWRTSGACGAAYATHSNGAKPGPFHSA